jgi:hypothetical protein
VVLTTKGGFHNLTIQVANAFGLPDARMVVVDHPLGGVEEEVIIGRAHTIVEEVLRLWTT